MPDLFKSLPWTIAAATFLMLSFFVPLLAAPLLLIWALVAGLLGYFRREWSGLPAIGITMLSAIFLVLVLNRLFFAQ
jgi:hypothetical protein